jgi:hypothetical protein
MVRYHDGRPLPGNAIKPITLRDARYAQSLKDRPAKILGRVALGQLVVDLPALSQTEKRLQGICD